MNGQVLYIGCYRQTDELHKVLTSNQAVANYKNCSLQTCWQFRASLWQVKSISR